VSAIVFVIKNGLRWRDVPPDKTIYNRFIRWSRLGVFNEVFAALAHRGRNPERGMIDAAHLRAHRTAAKQTLILVPLMWNKDSCVALNSSAMRKPQIRRPKVWSRVATHCDNLAITFVARSMRLQVQ
jgi:Putative transposase of IS4/5 family (DUF4096)